VRALIRLLAALALVAIARPADAAVIERSDDRGDDLTVITITGTLGADDIAAFRQVLAGVQRGAVLLDSPGGRMAAGLAIGNMVRLRGLATGVARGGECMSACALIWLAGVSRFLHEDGRVGFHAAFRTESGALRESGSGNALVGAYLTNLGYSLDLILEVTKASPYEMNILTPAMAARIGLRVEWLSDDDRAPTPRREERPARPALATVERAAEGFVRRHMRHHGLDGPVPEAIVDRHYARRIDYFGERIDREELKRRQRRYALRWPVHRIVPEGEPAARCSRGGMCTVTGTALFSARSEARNRRSDGRLRYTLRLERRMDAFVIVGEASEVLDRDLRPIRAAEARLVRRIQGELTRIGCNPGPIDGAWGPKTAAALARFRRAYQLAGGTGSPTERDLARLKSVRGIMCKN
jgi:hypothetical protein